MSYASISPHELCGRLNNGASVGFIDVRTPAEFREVHLPGARNLPLDRLNPQDFIGADVEELIVICQSGTRGRIACEKLVAAGHAKVLHVEGGVAACEQAGLEVRRGQKTMSLERQVRIAAGSLVFLGSLLALAVHPYFLALPAFVGAGLVFAGVTDTCGMGMLLARMPWNQVSCSTGCQVS